MKVKVNHNYLFKPLLHAVQTIPHSKMARRAGPANKNNWKTKPMPEKCTTIELNQDYSKSQMEAIKNGFIPEVMEDKWFIYYESSENKLYLHRSWTGYCMYIIQFEERGEDTFVATTAEVNRDPSQYSCTDDDEDKRTALIVVNTMLLGGVGSVGNPLESWSLLGRHSLH